ncbi:MAG: cardiolipin synthase, partial [Kiritimatiellae bacterium]|nr:cardiolipin synthase [Kiritimatiellia bacterium]
LFQDGLLHTKAVTIDDELGIFGTVNMDNRSMHLNFEMMLLVFDHDFVSHLVGLQESYEARSHCVNPSAWHARSFGSRLREGLCYLLSPLL